MSGRPVLSARSSFLAITDQQTNDQVFSGLTESRRFKGHPVLMRSDPFTTAIRPLSSIGCSNKRNLTDYSSP